MSSLRSGEFPPLRTLDATYRSPRTRSSAESRSSRTSTRCSRMARACSRSPDREGRARRASRCRLLRSSSARCPRVTPHRRRAGVPRRAADASDAATPFVERTRAVAITSRRMRPRRRSAAASTASRSPSSSPRRARSCSPRATPRAPRLGAPDPDGGARDAHERQRTLRATIEWSYAQLPIEAPAVQARCERTAVQPRRARFDGKADFGSVMPFLSVRVR